MTNELAKQLEAIAQNLQNNLTIEERLSLVAASGRLASFTLEPSLPRRIPPRDFDLETHQGLYAETFGNDIVSKGRGIVSLPPDVLVDARQDVVHKDAGPVRAGHAVKSSATPPESFAHPYEMHPNVICKCGARVPTDVYVLHTCGDRLSPPRRSSTPRT